MEKINTAKVIITYDGKDISAALAPYLLGVTYTDNEDGKADDLNISLEDSEHYWQDSWFPEKGSTLTASIELKRNEITSQMSCGTFQIDDISLSGPPDVVTIKAASITAKTLKKEKRCRGWENTTLEKVAGEIAKKHGLSLFYQVADLVKYDRADQRDESDLTFLHRLCKDQDLSLKVSDQKLIVFAGKDLESATSVFSIVRGTDEIETFSFNTKSHDVFKSAEVSYHDPKKKEVHKYTFDDPTGKDGQVLKIKKRATSLVDAKQKAKAALRKSNKDEVTASFTLFGDTGILSGLTGDVSGYGNFDGKYIVENCSHAVDDSGGYKTSLNLRKVMAW
ncbi:MAG: contractile injection system protein, VgrG/Pvc8 family [Desulfotalea sp.]